MQQLPNFVPAFSHHLKPLTTAPDPPGSRFIHASIAGSRSIAPLNRSNSGLMVGFCFRDL